MNPLLMLLGQQAAPEVAQSNIDVIGRRTRAEEQGGKYDDYVLNNTEAVRNRESDVRQTEEASTRKGMFGVKGTLRDVLGLVGDAFLVQGGRNPYYAPRRQQERISDAYAGYSVDPIAASERVAYYDPELGNELLKQAQTSKIAQGKLQGDIDTERRQAFDDATKRISQAYAAVLQDPSPENAAAALQLARNESEVLKIPLERLGVTPDMTEGVMRVLAGRGATVSQTMNLPLAERRVANSEANTSIARQRLEIGLRGVKDREKRTRIAEQALGLKRDDQQFDQMLDLFGISLDVEKERNRNQPRQPRSVPTTSPSTGQSWTIRPKSQ